jgi:hypothetical protein
MCHLAALFYKVLDDVEITATPMRETPGIVKNEARIPRRSDLFLDL